LNKKDAETRRVRFAQSVEKTRNELESETARLREVESMLESARSEHYVLADTLHSRQESCMPSMQRCRVWNSNSPFLSEQAQSPATADCQC